METDQNAMDVAIPRDNLALILQGILAHLQGDPKTRVTYQISVGADLVERIQDLGGEDKRLGRVILDYMLYSFFVTGMTKFFGEITEQHFSGEENLEAALKRIAEKMRQTDPAETKTVQ